CTSLGPRGIKISNASHVEIRRSWMLRLRNALVLALALAATGCGTGLMFVNLRDGMEKPRLDSNPGCPVYGKDATVDQLLEEADRRRDEFLTNTLPFSGPSERSLSDEEVPYWVQDRRTRLAAAINEKMAVWK